MATIGARLVCGLLLSGASMLAGCGPITATTALVDASAALEGARAVEADRYAAYEFIGAQARLEKAREEEGFSDFQAAIDLANEARELAEKARKRALSNPARGLPTTPGVPVAPVEDEPGMAEPPANDDAPGSHL